MGQVQSITSFSIKGLFKTKSIEITISDNALIVVGPNGIGKSSVANIFYFFVSRQWSRLLEYKFSEVSLVVDGQQITAKREDISGLSLFSKFSSNLRIGSRTSALVQKLIESGEVESFFSFSNNKRNTSAHEIERFAKILEIPRSEVPHFRMYIRDRIAHAEDDLFSLPKVELEKKINGLIKSRVLYLPTYRRIEKELKEIFPDFEERYRDRIVGNDMSSFVRSSVSFIELVSFGMEDVKKRIKTKMEVLRDYSLSRHNNLSAAYLSDVIHGKADNYVAQQINNLTDDQISAILDRVSETALPKTDKELLRSKVKDIQHKNKSQVAIQDKYLAHYFSRLVEVNSEITKKEKDIRDFVEVCNWYLAPRKRMVYDEITYAVKIHDEFGGEIDPSVLSSGEKQVIAIFSHIYLDDISNQIVVIDEPELSLSVPWQKRFLADIRASGRCDFLMAVTHSPFIYENELLHNSIDLRKVTTPYVRDAHDGR